MAAPAGGGEPSEASGAPTKDARPPEREGVDVERAPRPSCAECGSLSYTTAFLKDFGLAVCGACRKTHAKYDLVTKTAARETFLVPEAELAALPFTTKTNPRKQSWGRMKLYLRSAVEALSFARYGDAAGLMAEKRKREVAKLERQMEQARKRRKAERPPPRGAVALAPPPHTHDFQEVSRDLATKLVTEKCSACGLVSTYELL